ncbi:MAG TPA: DUF885 family protein [Pyrinomonadaceae bacterium]|nr:DUF885 family protein [Pyrinomonadaceae bacterium]
MKPDPTLNQSAKYSTLQNLAMRFWQWRAEHLPISYDDIPRMERPSGWVPDWSATAINARRHALANFVSELENLDPSGWSTSQQVDYRLIGSALARVRWELDITRSHEVNPDFYVHQTLGAIFLLLLRPSTFDPPRCKEIITRLRGIPFTVENAKQNLQDKAIRPFAVAAIDKLRNVSDCLDRVAVELQPLFDADSSTQLAQSTEDAIKALESFRQWLEDRLPQMNEETAVGRDAYCFFLRSVALMPFTPEQLLNSSKQEWERSIAFESFERTRNDGVPELAVFANQAVQIEREAQLENDIRRFLEARNILSVPDWVKHYHNLPLPSYLAPLSFMGVTDDLTSATRLDEDGISYIKVPSPNLDYFSLSIARDPRPLIVHEGVPGHYLQLALSWAHENPIRRQYYDSGANEGIGFYAEELMMQFGLFDDSPHTREVMYSFMKLRAVRVEVDVKLALGLFTIDQATNYLQKVADLDEATARQEATFFASSPGQAITYQIGKLQIVKFLADAKRIQRDNFNLRAFHDYVWKNGNVPIALQRWELLGLTDEITMLSKAQAV